MNKYNSITNNQFKLHEISLDDKSGIDTMIDNMNRSSDIIIPTIVRTGSIPAELVNKPTLAPAYEELPGVKVTLIPEVKEKENYNTEKVIDSKNEDTKKFIKFGIFSLVVIALIIVLLK